MTPDLEFSMEDNTGSIMVVSSTVQNFIPGPGDSIKVRGLITQNAGLTEIITDSILLLNKAIYGLLPRLLLQNSMNHCSESKIVKFEKAYDC